MAASRLIKKKTQPNCKTNFQSRTFANVREALRDGVTAARGGHQLRIGREYSHIT